MTTLAIKKNTFSERKKAEFGERYGKAKKVDLPALISERYGIEFSFGGSGKNGDAQGEGLRVGLTRDKQSGEEVWLANGTSKGDAVQTLQQLEKAKMGKDISKTQAIEIIEAFGKGRPTAINEPSASVNSSRSGIQLPAKADRNSDDLLSYVQGRGISWSTVTAAEADDFLQRSEKGLTFIGHDSKGNIKQADTRLMKPFKDDNGKEIRFLCAEGSDRSYPPILPGSPDSKSVHIVEGGFDALALREYLARKGQDATIIMSGGKDNTRWTEHQHIRDLMAGKTITVWRDNEKTPKVQAEADEAFQKLTVSLQQARVRDLVVSRPPSNLKDMAELNKHEKEQIRLRQQQELQQQTQSTKSR